jgi:hypothetical protein
MLRHCFIMGPLDMDLSNPSCLQGRQLASLEFELTTLLVHRLNLNIETQFSGLFPSMSKKRERVHKFNWQLIRLTLFSCLAFFAGCSITEKRAQLPPLVRTEHQLAKAEKITFDPPGKAAEILSVARTVASEIPKNSGDADFGPPVRIYNRAAADLAKELPKLNQYLGSPESFTVQNHHTGETYRLLLGPADRTAYPSTYFQELIDARSRKSGGGKKPL